VRRIAPARAELREGAEPSHGRAALFLLAHVPLALVMDRSNLVATFHAYGSFVFALLFCLRRDRPERAAGAAAYITGSEVLWRMTETQTFWEYGKYAIATLFLLWMLRAGSFRGVLLPVVYLLLLVPSASVTLSEVDPGLAKRMISFNLSGPIALAIASMFFLQTRFSKSQVGGILLVFAAPVVSVLTVALSSTLQSSRILFTNNSNWETSGGFGPNQVSAILGLGALVLFLVLSIRRHRPGGRVALFLLMVAFAAQSAMTFSRGGLYNAAGAGVFGALFLMRGAGSRARVLVIGALVAVLSLNVLLPRLDGYSNGQLTKRFGTTHTSGRDLILRDDLEIWDKNVLFGVGPGRSRFNRVLLASRIAAHTEYSRLLAEHGLFGLVAGIILIGLGVHRVVKTRAGWPQALAAACVLWAFLYMLHAAMRLAAPAYFFGLAFASMGEDAEVEAEESGEEEDDAFLRARGPQIAGRIRP